MRKNICFLVLLFITSLTVVAQHLVGDVENDIIYFKDGRVVQGIITKQQFGTISVRILDSTTFQYQTKVFLLTDIRKFDRQKSISHTDTIQSSVEHSTKATKHVNNQTLQNQNLITDRTIKPLDYKSDQNITLNPMPQEAPVSNPVLSDRTIIVGGAQAASPDDSFDPFYVPRPKNRKRIWNRQIRGYRGFVDYGYAKGIGANVNNRMEWGTSHGFQFNPIFYLGLGATYYMTLNKKDSSLPVFINPRINFIDENTTPFWDLRTGYSFADGKGYYFSTAFGVSFSKKGKQAFNLGLVYSLQNAKYYEQSKDNLQERIVVKVIYHSLGLRLTYEY